MKRFVKYTGIVVALVGITVAVGFSADQKRVRPPVPPSPKGVADVGQKAPDFVLLDTDGKTVTLQQYLTAGKTVVLYWFNAHCEVIINHFERAKTLPDLYSAYNRRKVVFLAINSTNPKHADFGGDAARKKDWLIHYPILLDPSGTVGKLYGAKTTPHVFIITSDGTIRYSGAIDNDPMGQKMGPSHIEYVSQALDEILAGKPVSEPKTHPYGCQVGYAR